MMVKCCICGLSFKKITNSHLNKRHDITSSEFSKKYPNAERGLMPWNKNKTKYIHPSLMKLSKKLILQRKWNFSKWQDNNRRKLARTKKKELKKDGNLAELVGIILGDGNLYKFARTERLCIICGRDKKEYADRISLLMREVFNKKPGVHNRTKGNVLQISLYQCGIAERLELPTGNKIRNNIGIPRWIIEKKIFMKRCLKGLFETDGCFQEDKKNYAQFIELKNFCRKLREDTYNILIQLGFNPQHGKEYVRLARKVEVERFKKFINFRNYHCPVV